MAEQRDFLFEKVAEIDADVANTYNKIKRTEGIDAARNYIDGLREQFENSSKYVEKYDSWEDFTGDKYKILAKLYNDYDGKYPTPIRMAKIKEKNPFITDDDVKRFFDLTNKYKEEEEKQAQYMLGKKERKEEVKRWPWYKDLLTSEYGKERYINEPEKSVWGEGPYWNKGEDVRDMILGGTAVVGELIPGWGGAIAGPAVRGLRDVLNSDNKLSNLLNYDTKYGKETSDIIKDFGLDLGTNIAIQKLPNFRKQKRMTAGMGGQNVNKYLDLQEQTKLQKNILENMPTPTEVRNLSNSELFSLVHNMPEGELKNRLLKAAPDLENIDRALINTELDIARKAVTVAENPNLVKQLKYTADNPTGSPFETVNFDEVDVPLNISKEPLAAKAISQPELTKWEKNVSLPFAKLTRTLFNDYGDQAMRIGTDVGYFPGKKSSPIARDTEKYPIKNYTRAFLLGEVPSEDAPIEIKKRYAEWLEKYKKEYGVYPEEDTMARLNPEE